MNIWIISVVVIFVLAQFVVWIKSFFLPLPIYILAGAFLAIASNYDKGIASFFSNQKKE